MPFEPRLFRDDDADDAAIGLPAEFAVLGQQLADDADFLASRYPSAPMRDATMELATSSDRRRRLVRWGGAAAAILLTIGGWQLVESRMADHGQPPAALPVTPLAVVNPSVIVPKRVATDDILPASVFRGLTGAEQEAVLDLMQDDPHQRGELSI